MIISFICHLLPSIGETDFPHLPLDLPTNVEILNLNTFLGMFNKTFKEEIFLSIKHH